jgi:hypothetical protein
MAWEVTVVTKREAAVRQLNQSIRLFFRRGDMLAVHTLTGAAFQLLADIGKISGVVSRFRSTELIRPDRMTEWIRALNSTQNFLKHAASDPEATHRYAEEGTILFLYEAVELAGRVISDDSRERLAFRLWFVFSFPEIIEPSVLEALRSANTVNLDQTDRALWARWLGES